MTETRGRKPKYDFSQILNSTEVEYDWTPSIRVSLFSWAKKRGVKVQTRKIGEKLKVYREG